MKPKSKFNYVLPTKIGKPEYACVETAYLFKFLMQERDKILGDNALYGQSRFIRLVYPALFKILVSIFSVGVRGDIKDGEGQKLADVITEQLRQLREAGIQLPGMEAPE